MASPAELIDALTQIDGLRVARGSRRSWFKSTAADAREIGTRLRVDAILGAACGSRAKRLRADGAARRRRDRLPALVASLRRHARRRVRDQDEIAARVVKALCGMLSSRDEGRCGGQARTSRRTASICARASCCTA
jgi:TolB-like protein